MQGSFPTSQMRRCWEQLESCWRGEFSNLHDRVWNPCCCLDFVFSFTWMLTGEGSCSINGPSDSFRLQLWCFVERFQPSSWMCEGNGGGEEKDGDTGCEPDISGEQEGEELHLFLNFWWRWRASDAVAGLRCVCPWQEDEQETQNKKEEFSWGAKQRIHSVKQPKLPARIKV